MCHADYIHAIASGSHVIEAKGVYGGRWHVQISEAIDVTASVDEFIDETENA